MLKKLSIFNRKITVSALENGVKSIEEIPGTKGFLGLGNALNYSKPFGEFKLFLINK
jgi:hypothetical protein